MLWVYVFLLLLPTTLACDLEYECGGATTCHNRQCVPYVGEPTPAINECARQCVAELQLYHRTFYLHTIDPLTHHTSIPGHCAITYTRHHDDPGLTIHEYYEHTLDNLVRTDTLHNNSVGLCTKGRAAPLEPLS